MQVAIKFHFCINMHNPLQFRNIEKTFLKSLGSYERESVRERHVLERITADDAVDLNIIDISYIVRPGGYRSALFCNTDR